MRNIYLAKKEFYHIYNRGTDKRKTFLYKNDYLKSCMFKTEKIIKMQCFTKSCVFATVGKLHFHIIKIPHLGTNFSF